MMDSVTTVNPSFDSIDCISPSSEGLISEEDAIKLRYELDKNYDEVPIDRSNGGSMCS